MLDTFPTPAPSPLFTCAREKYGHAKWWGTLVDVVAPSHWQVCHIVT